MAKILFRLNGVSDEEANDVRELLANHAIDFYETSAGNWGGVGSGNLAEK
jgi:hypothetical protein